MEPAISFNLLCFFMYEINAPLKYFTKRRKEEKL